jgi:hypothetical protein
VSVSVQALCQYQLKLAALILSSVFCVHRSLTFRSLTLVLCLYGIKMSGAQQGVVLMMPMAHNWCALLKFDVLTFLFLAS